MTALIEFISQLMVMLLSTFHRITQTYWIDIILLTAFVRVLISPINRQQTRTMKVMNQLQPKLKEIQEQYKDKPQELNTRMMQLYKDHKVNPMMGCLPMLIQMPILISLFYVLRSPQYYKLLPGFEQSSMFGARLTVRAFEGAPFPDIESLRGMVDLGSLFHAPYFYDKFLYLPALPLFAVYIATTILQTKQMQASSPQSQSQMNQMNFMMPLLIWFGLIFPVGLLLYWVLSNIFQMQQYAAVKHPSLVPEKSETKNTVQENASQEGKSEENAFTVENPEPAESHQPPPPPKKKHKKKK